MLKLSQSLQDQAGALFVNGQIVERPDQTK
jgi:hypothetical protein